MPLLPTLILTLLFFTLILSQSLLPPPPSSTVLTLPYSSLSLHQIPPTTGRILVEWSSETPATLSADGQPDIILTASVNPLPPSPSSASDQNCSQWQPCLSQISDHIAFNTHGNRASVLVETLEQPVFIRLENYARQRRFLGSELKPELNGELRIQQVSETGNVCGRGCDGKGSCEDGEGQGLGVCKCVRGAAGRFCDVVTQIRPALKEIPDAVEGGVVPLVDSAIVDGGNVYRWKVRRGKGKVVFRARILRGGLEVDGDVVRVGGSGVGTGLFVGQGGEWEKAKVLVERNGDGGVKDAYEWVSVVEEAGEWLVWPVRNITGGLDQEGEVVYSVRVGRCGDGVACPFEGRGSVVPTGVFIGIGAVVGVLIIVGILFWCCKAKKSWVEENGNKESGGAWDRVDFGKMGERREGLSSGSTLSAPALEEGKLGGHRGEITGL